MLQLLRALAGRLLALPAKVGWGLAAGWFALIWVASSFPATPAGGHPAWGLVANLAHAPLFGLLALWLVPALTARRGGGSGGGGRGAGAPGSSGAPGAPGAGRLTNRIGGRILVLVLIAGTVDELHQGLGGAGRHLSLLDLVTDLVGAACALALVALLERERVTAVALGRRLALAALACLAAAALATWAPGWWPGVPGL